MPLGDNLQEKAQKYFEDVFSYFRNYVTHDGAYIDEAIRKCKRQMYVTKRWRIIAWFLKAAPDWLYHRL